MDQNERIPERIPLNTDIPADLREEFDVARARRGRIKINFAVEAAIRQWIADARGVAPVLLEAYYNGRPEVRGKLHGIVADLLPKSTARDRHEESVTTKTERRRA